LEAFNGMEWNGMEWNEIEKKKKEKKKTIPYGSLGHSTYEPNQTNERTNKQTNNILATLNCRIFLTPIRVKSFLRIIRDDGNEDKKKL
jgi:hypothetical protein